MSEECKTCKLKGAECASVPCEHFEMYEPWHCCETCSAVGMCGHMFGNYSISANLDERGECSIWIPKGGLPFNKDTALSRHKGKRGASLRRALDIINGERQSSYGSPEDSFQIIAEFWETYLTHRNKGPLSPIDVARMMSLMKHARMLGQADKEDNYVDAAGYLGIAGDIVRENNE
jgi:hypothetical protein